MGLHLKEMGLISNLKANNLLKAHYLVERSRILKRNTFMWFV